MIERIPATIVRNELIIDSKLEQAGVRQITNVIIAKIIQIIINLKDLRLFFRNRGSVIFSGLNLGHCPSSNNLHWIREIGIQSPFCGNSRSIRAGNCLIISPMPCPVEKL